MNQRGWLPLHPPANEGGKSGVGVGVAGDPCWAISDGTTVEERHHAAIELTDQTLQTVADSFSRRLV